MLDLQLTYDPSISVERHIYRDNTLDADKVVQLLQIERIPSNLVPTCIDRPFFKDAVIHSLLTRVFDELEQRAIMELLGAALASTQPDDTPAIRIYSEILAAVAYSWGETILATRAVLRNEPGKAGTILSSIAVALSKKMDSENMKMVLTNTTSNGASLWLVEQQSLVTQ